VSGQVATRRLVAVRRAVVVVGGTVVLVVDVVPVERAVR
jgi:hypothetical protein